mmetsp:Transcript_10099/g.21200  ORF Transcript_10099/g.21200 Transcript_10099/m.21200 type:complete len:80 (+) Transcript_10099:203-442(+)
MPNFLEQPLTTGDCHVFSSHWDCRFSQQKSSPQKLNSRSRVKQPTDDCKYYHSLSQSIRTEIMMPNNFQTLLSLYIPDN